MPLCSSAIVTSSSSEAGGNVDALPVSLSAKLVTVASATPVNKLLRTNVLRFILASDCGIDNSTPLLICELRKVKRRNGLEEEWHGHLAREITRKKLREITRKMRVPP